MASVFRLHGKRLGATPSRAEALRLRVEAAIASLREEDAVDLSDIIAPALETALHLRREIDKINSSLTEIASNHPVCSKFVRIPSISALTAISFLTAIDDPWRFSRSSDVPAYLGLTPKWKSSGGSEWQAGISKAGNTLTRTHLVIAATVLLSSVKQESALRDWGRGRVDEIGFSKARIAVARKLAIIMHTLWKNDTEFKPYP